MKQFILFLAMLVLAIGTVARAQSPDDQYVRIYNLIQQAEDLQQSGQRRAAFEKYQQAETALKSLATTHPDWSPRIVKFRLDYLAEKLASFGPAPAPVSPAATVGPTALSPASPILIEKPSPDKVPQAAELQNQVRALQEENRRLNEEKAKLDAKWREALSAQPATIDLRELAKAELKIRALEKENELLKVTLQQTQLKVPKAADATALATVQQALAEANRKLAEQTQLVSTLKMEKEVLQARVPSTPPVATTKPAASTIATTELALLKTENEVLKKQLTDLRSRPNPVAPAPAPVVATRAERADAKKIKQLEQERADLLKKLDAANLALAANKNKKTLADWQQLTNQLNGLQAKLAVYEAAKVPLTDAEAALLKTLPSTNAPIRAAQNETPGAPKKPVNDLPAGASLLVAQAQKAFASGQFDEAEKTYRQVLTMDEKNIFVLGDLATVQLNRTNLDAAEKTLKQAISLDPSDANNLSLWGILKFRQRKLDEALDALSRSAKLDPNNPQTQNFLGMTLNESGHRETAETALRKAIRINPDYTDAHFNLAIVYAFQTPPSLELARYHYQKALARGHEKHPGLEKLLEGKR